MLKRSHRHTTRQFERVFKRGKRIHTPRFMVIYAPRHAGFKASVVIKKKTAKRAPDRNHLRRQVYHAIRKWAAETHPRGGFIWLYKGTELGHNPADLARDMAAVTRKINQPK